jgi:hypothetical protein
MLASTILKRGRCILSNKILFGFGLPASGAIDKVSTDILNIKVKNLRGYEEN